MPKLHGHLFQLCRPHRPPALVQSLGTPGAAPNEKWLTDITEFHIPAGKVYLSPIIDCFDGLVISWTIGTHPDADLVNTMLDAAIKTVAGGNDRPVVHSDRGSILSLARLAIEDR